MSGVAEAVAGLTISAVSVAALFSTCLDCFDIIVKVRDFEPDFEILCTDLDLQRLRFCLWGESIGLTSRDTTIAPVPLAGLNDPEIQPKVIRALQAIQLLLGQTDGFRDRVNAEASSSRPLRLFKDTFTRLRHGQRLEKRPSLKTKTWWAIHAGDKFRDKIERLKSLIEGLESVTKALEVIDLQRSWMRDEIDSLNDVNDLRLVENASLRSHPDVSDTASRRILMIETGSVAYTQSRMLTENSSTGQTYHTAGETASKTAHSSEMHVTGTSDDLEDLDHVATMQVPQHKRILAHAVANATKPPPWKAGPTDESEEYGFLLEVSNVESVVERYESRQLPQTLSYIYRAIWNDNKFAETTTQVANIIHQLQPFKKRQVPRWIAAATLKDTVSCVLAGMEGAPNTPYERGVFWLSIWVPRDFPFSPPKVRFLTRVYHPNIDRGGNICVDILRPECWSASIDIERLLVSICSLLSGPNLEDPLVPEIAQTYCEDYELYCHNARQYTEKYASVDFAEVSKAQAIDTWRNSFNRLHPNFG